MVSSGQLYLNVFENIDYLGEISGRSVLHIICKSLNCSDSKDTIYQYLKRVRHLEENLALKQDVSSGKLSPLAITCIPSPIFP